MTESPVLPDFATTDQASRWPRHGWAVNSQGCRLLWFPVLRIARHAADLRQVRGAGGLPPARADDASAFYASLRRLVRCLTRLSICLDEISDLDLNSADPTRPRFLGDQAEELVEWSYIYARRTARLVMAAIAPALVRDYKQLRDLRDLRGRIERGTLDLLHPLVQADCLNIDWAWLDLLHGADRTALDRGFRDMFEHDGGRPLGGIASHDGHSSFAYRHYVHTNWSAKQGIPITPDLVPLLHNVASGLCQFFAAATLALDHEHQRFMGREDWFFDVVVGPTGAVNDERYTHFWPEI